MAGTPRTSRVPTMMTRQEAGCLGLLCDLGHRTYCGLLFSSVKWDKHSVTSLKGLNGSIDGKSFRGYLAHSRNSACELFTHAMGAVLVPQQLGYNAS